MNYKAQNKNKIKKLKLVGIGITLLAIAATGLYALRRHNYRTNQTAPPSSIVGQSDKDGNPPTNEELQEAASTDVNKKQGSLESPNNSTNTTLSADNIVITAKKEDNNTVTVFTRLKGFSSGTCKLTVTNGSRSTSQQVDIIYQSAFSSCAGFSVPIDSVGTGNWTINLFVSSNGMQFTKTITKDIN